MNYKEQKRENILFTNFYYILTNAGGLPDANSYVKIPNQIDEFLENDLSEVQSFKITLNCQVNTNRNTAPIQTQALIKAYNIEIDGRTRQFFIEKQNFLHIIFNNKSQTAQKFLHDIQIPAESILKLFNQFWQDLAIQVYVQVQIECCY